MSFFIYKITNLLNNKLYIGQTNNFQARWKQYTSFYLNNKPKQLIIQAMIKYGIIHFKYELIEVCISREKANEREIFYISQYNSLSPNGYNIENGGKFAPLSQESLNKISKALKGRPSINKGKPCSEDQKLKTSQTMIGRKYSKERSQNISNGLKGLVPWNKGKSKLSESEINLIKLDSRKYKEIAEEYKISKSTVCQIKKK